MNSFRGEFVTGKFNGKEISIYLYINVYNQLDMNAETKLTTVKIIKGVYSNLKRVSFESDVTLQNLVNRTVERYVTDEDFRKEMNEYLKLQVSGSQF